MFINVYGLYVTPEIYASSSSNVVNEDNSSRLKIIILKNGNKFIGKLINYNRRYYKIILSKSSKSIYVRKSSVKYIRPNVNNTDTIKIVSNNTIQTDSSSTLSKNTKNDTVFSYNIMPKTDFINKIKLLSSIDLLNTTTMYYLFQVGMSYTWFSQQQYSLSSEFMLGGAYGSKKINGAINIAPVILNYQLNKDFAFDIVPELYFRTFKDGSKISYRVLMGVGYLISNGMQLKFRIGYSNGLTLGFAFALDLKNIIKE